MADEKDVGKADRACGGAEGVDVSESVLYLFYLRLVLLPHHLVRGSPPNKWWAECNETGGSGRGFPIHSCPFLLLIFSHRLVDYAADGVRRLPFHPLGGVGAGCLRRTFYRCRNILSIRPIKISRSLGISSLSTSSSSPSSTLPTSGPGATPAAMMSRPSTARSFNVRHCR